MISLLDIFSWCTNDKLLPIYSNPSKVGFFSLFVFFLKGIYTFNVDNLSEIIKKRSAPGILIFDLHERLLYSNGEALEMLAALQKGEAEGLSVPEEIHHLCRQLEGGVRSAGRRAGS